MQHTCLYPTRTPPPYPALRSSTGHAFTTTGLPVLLPFTYRLFPTTCPACRIFPLPYHPYRFLASRCFYYLVTYALPRLHTLPPPYYFYPHLQPFSRSHTVHGLKDTPRRYPQPARPDTPPPPSWCGAGWVQRSVSPVAHTPTTCRRALLTTGTYPGRCVPRWVRAHYPRYYACLPRGPPTLPTPSPTGALPRTPPHFTGPYLPRTSWIIHGGDLFG